MTLVDISERRLEVSARFISEIDTNSHSDVKTWNPLKKMIRIKC